MADTAAFLVRFPEFSAATTSLLDVVLAEAESRTDNDVWGDRYDAGVYFLMAHLLAISPNSKNLGVCRDKDGSTRYWKERYRMGRALASGNRLADPDFTLPPDGPWTPYLCY